ncbi:MAG: NADH-quinone oxidoreductase subunit L [Xanthomonadales bacterium]|nr:NADH-quinone oxidoreductase subunit L [Xanthomonadales bacterium]
MKVETIILLIPLLPLAGALIAGLLRNQVGRTGSHIVTILGVGGAFVLSALILKMQIYDGMQSMNYNLYTWGISDSVTFQVGFLIDHLTSLMMVVVTFVSLMVHIYTIGYMRDDPGYQRFFSYIALFTFSMLVLVMSNNFLQLFFAWEAVGLVSYLLIGFWYKKETAIFANMKAFMVNRVGDFGFLLGIAAIMSVFGTLDYAEVFAAAPSKINETIAVFGGIEWSAITFICVGLFIGAMGKSAQAPLHVWLPDSMEGPTPISALIHAATMVTAGIFMVARMSPLFELSDAALSFVLIIGGFTALAMGMIGIVQNDIKRVIAYSTLSQLGYMTVALGASAYSAAIFHLMTHAFFKALLFLAAGSVIIAMHHEQDMRKMGGVKRWMPVTWITSVLGTLALIGFPFFSGFYSKDMIIEAVGGATRFGSGFAYWAVLLGVVVTAFYSFRLLYLVFHGKSRMDKHTEEHMQETPLVVTIPLVLLAIPSVLIGYFTIKPILFGGWLDDAIKVSEQNDVVAALGENFHGATALALHSVQTAPFWLMIAGFALATWFYLFKPQLAESMKKRFSGLYSLLENKYYFDDFNNKVFARGFIRIGNGLWKRGDAGLIDGIAVNGTAAFIGKLGERVRKFQTGYLYQYAFAMIIGLIGLLGAWLLV